MISKQSVEQVNLLLSNCSATDTVNWVKQSATNAVVSTSFGPNSAVLLHMVTRIMPDIPVIWVDSGYNTNATYRFALDLMENLHLNMKIYTPSSTSAFLNVKMKGIPDIETQEHDFFTETVKLEPFKRALEQLNPDMWITGIRAEETIYRQSLSKVSSHASMRLKIAPLLDWSQADIAQYIDQFGLPVETNYFDPTKSFEGRECGLHTRL